MNTAEAIKTLNDHRYLNLKWVARKKSVYGYIEIEELEEDIAERMDAAGAITLAKHLIKLSEIVPRKLSEVAWDRKDIRLRWGSQENYEAIFGPGCWLIVRKSRTYAGWQVGIRLDRQEVWARKNTETIPEAQAKAFALGKRLLRQRGKAAW